VGLLATVLGVRIGVKLAIVTASPPVSPSVVASTFMIQKPSVTAGTLLTTSSTKDGLELILFSAVAQYFWIVMDCDHLTPSAQLFTVTSELTR